jgi:hypothetical protein
MLPALQGLGLVPYVADHDLQDSVLSTMYVDLRRFSPTLCGVLSAALLALVCKQQSSCQVEVVVFQFFFGGVGDNRI